MPLPFFGMNGSQLDEEPEDWTQPESDLDFSRWAASLPSLRLESPQLQQEQAMTPQERMGLAFSEVQPYRDAPGESGGSAFLRALLTGTARGYGSSVQSSLAERKRRLEAANEAEQRRAALENQRQMALFQMGPSWMRAMRPETPKLPDPMDELVDTPATMRSRTGLARATRQQIATYMKPTGTGGGSAAAKDDYTPRQRRDMERIERRFKPQVDRLNRSILAIQEDMRSPYIREEARERLKADLAAAEAKLDSLETQRNRDVDRALGVASEPAPSPAAGGEMSPEQFWVNALNSAATLSEAESIAATVKQLMPEVFSGQAFKSAAKTKHGSFSLPARKAQGTTSALPTGVAGYGELSPGLKSLLERK